MDTHKTEHESGMANAAPVQSEATLRALREMERDRLERARKGPAEAGPSATN